MQGQTSPNTYWSLKRKMVDDNNFCYILCNYIYSQSSYFRPISYFRTIHCLSMGVMSYKQNLSRPKIRWTTTIQFFSGFNMLKKFGKSVKNRGCWRTFILDGRLDSQTDTDGIQCIQYTRDRFACEKEQMELENKDLCLFTSYNINSKRTLSNDTLFQW